MHTIHLFALLMAAFALADQPQIDYDTSPSARSDAGSDFGNVEHNLPFAVVFPSSVSELVDIVDAARGTKTPIAAVGQAHSVLGQAQALNGIVVNMTNLNQVLSIDADSAWVEAGATWRELLQATLVQGKTPPVFTDYIDLSIGGTLSVGGIGTQTFRTGLQVDNVLQLEVVTGKGKVETCSPTQKSDLFYSVLAGHGQFAIITKARISLVPAFENTRFVRTLYSDIEEFTDDLFILTSDQRYDGVQGFVVPNDRDGLDSSTGFAFPNVNVPVGDGTWLYMIEASVYYDGSAAPSVESLTQGLRHIPEGVNVLDMPYFAFIARLDPVVEFLTNIGLWELPHVWIDVYVPRSEAVSYVQGELDRITPFDVNGPILFYPCLSAPFNTPNYIIPDSDEFILFALLRTVVDTSRVDEFLQDNVDIYNRALAVGGTGYAIDAVPLNPASWENHFGPDHYHDLEVAKRQYDSKFILTPGQNMFTKSSSEEEED